MELQFQVKVKTFKIKKDEVLVNFKLKEKVKKGDLILKS